jgi:prepilin-type N-terminal cleavage/methylation domain-containing protein
MNTRRAIRRSDGFTLPELLVTMTVLGIIIAAIAAAIIVSLKNDSRSADSLRGSRDAQTLALWLPSDVQSAGPTGIDPSAATPTGCLNSPAQTATNFNVLRLTWTETTTTYYAAYRAVQTSGSEPWQLVRTYCTAGTAANTVIVVHNLANGSAATVVNTGSQLGLNITTSIGTPPYSFSVTGTPRTPNGATTTTVPPSTTTTVPPTTTTIPPTTTTVACSFSSASPSSINRKQGGSGNLTQAYVFTVLTNGSCSAITLKITPSSSQVTISAFTQGPAGTWTHTVGASDYSWTAGAKTVTVWNGSTQIGSYTLTVLQA